MSWNSFNVKGSVNRQLLRRRVKGMRFLWGREERRGKETATAACLMYLPRRESAGGGDPEALYSA